MEANSPERYADTAAAGFSRQRSTFVSSLPRLVAFTAWGAFVLFCLGMSFSRGLCCADDGWFAVTAKNIAVGDGYLKPLNDYTEAPSSLRFNPPFGVGPTVVVPGAAMLTIFGNNEAVPGVTAVLLWASVFTALLVRVARQEPSAWFLLAVVVFLFAILSVFPFHFEQWFAFLGEIPAAALSLLAFWIVAMERLSRKRLILAGTLLGLSVQAKLLVVLTVPAFLIVLGTRLRGAALEKKARRMHGALALTALSFPTVAFEAIKLQQLGTQQYARKTLEFLKVLKEKGLQFGHLSPLQLVHQRVELIDDRFAIPPLALVVFAVLTVMLSRAVLEKRWRLLFLGLSVSIWSLGIYWLFFSIGWPRYLVIAFAMACFALSVPVLASRRAWQKGVFAVLAVALVAGGITRLPFVLRRADNGLFRPSNERLARARVVSTIEDLTRQRSVILCSPGWASFVDVDFSLKGHRNFRGLDNVSGLPGRKIVLINRRFVDENVGMVRDLRARASATLLSDGPYELLQLE